MDVETQRTFETLLASEPGPTSMQLAELVVKRPEFYDYVVAELVRRRAWKRPFGNYRNDPWGVAGAFAHMVDKMPDRRLALWPLCTSTHPGENWLVHCMRQYPELRERAWVYFVPQCGHHIACEPLGEIIRHVPELRDRAWEQRKKVGHQDTDFHSRSLVPLLKYLPREAQQEAWEIIRCTSGEGRYTTILAVFECAPVLREAAFAQLCTQGYLGRCVMSSIFIRYPAFRERAWQQILVHDATEVPHLPDEAGRRLLGLVNGKEVPEPLRLRALEEILRRKPFEVVNLDEHGDDDWWFSWIGRVVIETPSLAVRRRAWEFARRQIDTKELQVLTRNGYCAELRVEIWEELLSRSDAPGDFLSGDMLRSKDFRFRAVKAILDRDTGPDVLKVVIEQAWVPARARAQALRKLFGHPENLHTCVRLLENEKIGLEASALTQLGCSILASSETLNDYVLDLVARRVPDLAPNVDARRQRGTGNLLSQLMR